MATPDTGDWTIAEVVAKLGISEKTVRRHIQDGVIKAEMREGKYGKEWHVLEMPAIEPGRQGKTRDELLEDMVKEKDQQIAQLHEMLGAARMRISELEAQVKLLDAPKKRPWWRRLFGR